MKKLLIVCCGECKFSGLVSFTCDPPEYNCKLLGKKNIIPDISFLPDWCPLEDEDYKTNKKLPEIHNEFVDNWCPVDVEKRHKFLRSLTVLIASVIKTGEINYQNKIKHGLINTDEEKPMTKYKFMRKYFPASVQCSNKTREQVDLEDLIHWAMEKGKNEFTKDLSTSFYNTNPPKVEEEKSDESWVATAEFRWKYMNRTNELTTNFLQQKWVSNKGELGLKEEWRTVPISIE